MNLSLFLLVSKLKLFFVRTFTKLRFLACTAAFGFYVHLLLSCVLAVEHLGNGNPGAGGQAGVLDTEWDNAQVVSLIISLFPITRRS